MEVIYSGMNIDENVCRSLKSFREVESLTREERKKYFNDLREVCKERFVRPQTNSFVLTTMGLIAPFFRNYKLIIEGDENIPKNEEVIFLCNHSNTHDFYTIREVFYKIKKPVTTLVAWDGLNGFSRFFFRLGDVTLIKRDNAASKENGVLDHCSKILNRKSGIVFGEATWNLHPTKPMLGVKAGTAEMAMITGKKVIPTIFEYVEVDSLCTKESDLYDRCIVSFGKPVQIDPTKSLFEQTDYLQKTMESMRRAIWEREGIKKTCTSDEDILRYVNHTYLKKYKAFGFKYDTSHESNFLLNKGTKIENEYHIDSDGEFVPGSVEENIVYQ